MTDINVQPRAHARIVYLGPVSPHWEVYGDYGDRTLLDEFRARVLARLVLLPRDDPQSVRRSRSSGISASSTKSPDTSRRVLSELWLNAG